MAADAGEVGWMLVSELAAMGRSAVSPLWLRADLARKNTYDNDLGCR